MSVFTRRLIAACGFLFLICVAPLARAEQPANVQFGEEFWSHWGDGQAEIATYDLVFERYGQPREGTAVAIFVTETFSHSARVKADPGRHPASDTFPVMKLNLVEDFPTGIYDYNLMTSTFVALAEWPGHERGTPTKLSHSMQEWCGQAWIQMRFEEKDIEYELHSYFDGEADQKLRLDWPAGGTTEDAVLLWARGLAAPFLEAGETSTRPLLTSAKQLRLEHKAPEWSDVEYRRGSQTEKLDTPAGEFDVIENSITRDGELLWRVWVEADAPHRIVRWTNAHGQSGNLIATERIPYWQRNGNGGVADLESLGLRPRATRTP